MAGVYGNNDDRELGGLECGDYVETYIRLMFRSVPCIEKELKI